MRVSPPGTSAAAPARLLDEDPSKVRISILRAPASGQELLCETFSYRAATTGQLDWPSASKHGAGRLVSAACFSARSGWTVATALNYSPGDLSPPWQREDGPHPYPAKTAGTCSPRRGRRPRPRVPPTIDCDRRSARTHGPRFTPLAQSPRAYGDSPSSARRDSTAMLFWHLADRRRVMRSDGVQYTRRATISLLADSSPRTTEVAPRLARSKSRGNCSHVERYRLHGPPPVEMLARRRRATAGRREGALGGHQKL